MDSRVSLKFLKWIFSLINDDTMELPFDSFENNNRLFIPDFKEKLKLKSRLSL